MSNTIRTFTQRVHAEGGIFYENYLHINDFINIYLKDVQIEVLQKEPNQINRGKIQMIEEIIKELNRVNEELNGEN